MLPRPSFLALIALERFERDDKHPFRALRPQPRVNFVKRARRRRHAERCRQAAGEPVEIIVWTEWFVAIRHSSCSGSVQIDEIKVGGVRQRMTAEPSQSNHYEFTLREDAVALFKFRRGR